MSGLLRRITRSRAADAGEPPPGGVAAPPDAAPTPAEPVAGPATPPAEVVPAGLDPAEVTLRPPAGRRGRLRRRLRYLRRARELMLRDLGGLLYEVHRTGGGQVEPHATVIGAKVQRLTTVDAEAHAIEHALGSPRGETVVFQPGVGGTCEVCGELYGSAARFCSNCGAGVAAAPASFVAPAPAPSAPTGDEQPTAAIVAEPKPSRWWRRAKRAQAAGQPSEPAGETSDKTVADDAADTDAVTTALEPPAAEHTTDTTAPATEAPAAGDHADAAATTADTGAPISDDTTPAAAHSTDAAATPDVGAPAADDAPLRAEDHADTAPTADAPAATVDDTAPAADTAEPRAAAGAGAAAPTDAAPAAEQPPDATPGPGSDGQGNPLSGSPANGRKEHAAPELSSGDPLVTRERS